MSIAEQLTTIAENVSKVYEVGKTDEWNSFWDDFQVNGTRTNYYVAFYGPYWNNTNFKPKYPIRPDSLNNAFANCGISGDLTELCELDTSKCTEFSSAFNGCTGLTRIGVIDCTRASGNLIPFDGCTALKTIDKVILKSNGSHGLTRLTNCTSLENITIEGVQGVSCDYHWCPFSRDSIISIINALSTTATEQTLTLSETAVNNAFETGEGTCDGAESEEWNSLVAGRPNWTISLV